MAKLGKVKYCKKCVVPSSSAIPIEFNDEGICSGCRTAEQKYEVGWERRGKILDQLLDGTWEKDNLWDEKEVYEII